MTARDQARTTHPPASDAAIEAAGAIYGSILADPERAEQIRAHQAADAATQDDVDFCSYCASLLPRTAEAAERIGPAGRCTSSDGQHTIVPSTHDESEEVE